VDRPPAFVLCHADLHAGNVLVPDPAHFYIVDWDNPLLAPKERDLMSIGAGLMGGWRSPAEEESLFYQGYGPTTINPTALAYYRYERIIDDIAVFCDQLLETTAGGEDRAQSFAYLASNFLPNGTIEIAQASDSTRENRRGVRTSLTRPATGVG
jgi:spectinomycin phosphotransferase